MKNLFVLACLLASISSYSQTEGEIFKVVEVMPRFPSSCEDDVDLTNQQKKQCADKEMLQFVYSNLKYPAEAKRQGISGIVVIAFTLDKEGFILDPEVKRSANPMLDEAALEVIEKMQAEMQWIPGSQQGKPVAVKFNLPIRFY
jgi:protein TonB